MSKPKEEAKVEIPTLSPEEETREEIKKLRELYDVLNERGITTISTLEVKIQKAEYKLKGILEEK